GSEIETEGEVRFRSSPYGTELEVEMSYQPPGTAGAIAARLARSLTQSMLREDLRRFKRLMEAGEVPTAAISQSQQRPLETERRLPHAGAAARPDFRASSHSIPRSPGRAYESSRLARQNRR